MDQEDEYGGLFLVSVDDLGAPGLWASTKDLLESRSTLYNLMLHNKLGRAVTVDRLTLQLVASGDKKLQRLRPFAHSPVVWFRHPYAHVLLVSTVDVAEYRSVLKPALKKAIADLERDWGGPPAAAPPPPQPSGMGALLGGGAAAAAAAPPGVLGVEWLIAYVRPAEVDMGDKAAKKVYDKLKDDFSPRGRTRVIRVDMPKGFSAAAVAAVAGGGGGSWTAARGPGGGGGGGVTPLGVFPGLLLSSVLGLDDFELCLRECVRSSFEARQAAYMAEVQRLANERRDPNWSFASLYLLKDSLALLLEGCGMHTEAYKEFVELEAAYQETLDRQQQQQQQLGAGGGAAGPPGGPLSPDLQEDTFGASGEGAEVATLISASWRVMRKAVLKRAAVQEFCFRQYLFASQTRLLLRLGRPVDAAERGLRFIGSLAAELAQRERAAEHALSGRDQPAAARERAGAGPELPRFGHLPAAAGGVRPLFKEAWTLSACLAVIAAVTASVFGREAAPAPPLLAGGAAAAAAPAAAAAAAGGCGGGHARSSSWDVSSGAGGEPAAGVGPRSVRGSGAGPGAAATAAATPMLAPRDAAQRAAEVPPAGGSQALAEDGSASAAAAAATSAARAWGPVDWQLWVPFEAEVPTLDPAALCGQTITPAALAASRPADAEALLRQETFQSFMLALAHLYCTALSALLRLAHRAAQLVRAPPTPTPTSQRSEPQSQPDMHEAAAAASTATENDWFSLLTTWRQGLQELPPQYACRAVVGLFVDQEEDRQFEATPQQQATQLQLLRQAISGAVGAAGAAGGGASFTAAAGASSDIPVAGLPAAAPSSPLHPQGNVVRSRGDASPGGSSPVWLTPPGTGNRPYNRSESLYSVSIAAGPAATASPACAVDTRNATPQQTAAAAAAATAASGAAAGSIARRSGGFPAGRASWATDNDVMAAGVPGGAAAGTAPRLPRKSAASSHHAHSGSADSAGGSFLSKLDVFASRVSYALDPLRLQHQQHQQHQQLQQQLQQLQLQQQQQQLRASGGAAGLRAVEAQAARASVTSSAPQASQQQQQQQQQQQLAATPEQLHGGLGPGMAAPASSAAALLLPADISWLQDWRVRLALSSPGCCGDLALQLALAAATCYSRAGRQRAAAQLYGDVGAVLLARGQAEVVAELLEHVVSLAQAEGWHALLGRALTVLMTAQQAIGHVMLPYTCVRYLSLPPLACHAGVRRRVMEHVLTSGGCCPVPDGAGRVRRPPLPSAVLQLSTGQAVQAALLPGWSSKFFGRCCASGLPSLVPPARPAARSSWQRRGGGAGACTAGEGPQHGNDDGVIGGTEGRRRCSKGGGGSGAAQILRVGDVCSLELQVYSNLPTAVPLSDLHLVLGTLQRTQPSPLSAHSSHHHHHHGRQSQQQHQQHGQAQFSSQAATAATSQQPTLTGHRSFSGTTAQQPALQPGAFQRPPSSSFSQAQSQSNAQTQSHAHQPYGDAQSGTGVGTAAPSASGSRRGPSASGQLGPAAAAAPGGPPPAALHRQTAPDVVGMYGQNGSTDDGAAAAQMPYSYPQQHPQQHHLQSHQGGLARVSGSGMLYGSVASAPGSSQALSQMAGSPTFGHVSGGGGSGGGGSGGGGGGAASASASAASAAGAGPSRLVHASRGGGGGGGGGSGLDRRASSNTSSSLSLAQGHVGGIVSESSGLGRRAPSWADTLSAAASMAPVPAGTQAGRANSVHDVMVHGASDVIGGGGGGGALASPGSTRAGAEPGWAAADDLACHHLVEIRHVRVPGQPDNDHQDFAPAASSSSPSADSRTVVLQPGLTRLTFRVVPTRPGLYFARHLAASIGSYDLRIPVVPAVQLAADIRATTGGWTGLGASAAAGAGAGAATGGGGSFTFGGLGLSGTALGTAAAIAQLGQVEDGEVRHLEVALRVDPLVPRLLAGPVLVGGTLAAGLPQWLGVALAPLDADCATRDPRVGSCSDGDSEIAGGLKGAGGGVEGGDGDADGDSGGLQHVRVHVQARAQSALRLGEWSPAPPASTPLGPLSTMPSLHSLGGAPMHLQHSVAHAGELPAGGGGCPAAAAGPASGGGSAVVTASGFASPAVAAATAAALAATASFHPAANHHLQHPPPPPLQQQQPGLMSAPTTFRRPEAAGHCRVAVIDLHRAAAAAAAENELAAAAATTLPSTSLPGRPAVHPHSPRPSESAEGSSPDSGGAVGGAAPGPAAAASGAAATTAEGRGTVEVHWAVSGRQGIDLSQALSGPLRSPVLLWLPVWVPPAASVVGSDDKAPLEVAPEVVRVQQAHAGVTSSRYSTTGGLNGRRATVRPGTANLPGNGRVSAVAPTPHHLPAPPQGPQKSPGPRPLPPLELEVVVEGVYDGMWRSHATSLSVPLQQPFRVRTSAHQLPNTTVLVSITVTSCLALPVLITEVVLEPQYGLVLGTDPSGGGGAAAGGHLLSLVPGLLPLQLSPNEAATWGFVLSRSAEAVQSLSGLHQDDCCLLHMAFTVTQPADGTAAPAVYEVLGPALQPVSGYRYPLPPLSAALVEVGGLTPHRSLSEPGGSSPPGHAPPHAQPKGAGCCANVYSHTGTYTAASASRGYDSMAAASMSASGAGASFSHGFILEFPPSNALTHNLVSVRLMGPHSAALGQPTHMTWLVTRVSSPPASASGASASAGDSDDVAVYEVAEAADAADGSGTAAAGVLHTSTLGGGGCTTGGGGGGSWQWRQALGCRGSVRLGRAKGSVAVVEAVVVPVAAGMLRAPVLRLRGLREVREEDLSAATADYVMVSAAAQML